MGNSELILINTFFFKGAYVDLAESPRILLNRVSASSLKSDAVFSVMEDRIKANLEKVKKINGVFVYKITKSGKDAATWSKLSFHSGAIVNISVCSEALNVDLTKSF